MPGIFISYRRSDSDIAAGRIADDLAETFGASAIFRDVDTLEPGEDYTSALDRALASCAVLLVVIGPRWLSVTNEQGGRRLDDPSDWVRLEVSRALTRGIRVIPVLVGASMPRPSELPDDLEPLLRRQAFEMSDRHWRQDISGLAAALTRVPGIAAPAVPLTRKRRWPVSRLVLTMLAGTAAMWLIVLFAPRFVPPSGPGASTFVTASLADESLVQRLKRDLPKQRLSFPVDEAGLRTTEPLVSPIQEALQKTRYVLLLWSKAASESLFVRAEILAAYRLRKPVVTCLLDNTAVPAFLRGLAVCDLRRADDPDSYRQSIAKLPGVMSAAAPIPPVAPLAEPSPDKQRVIRDIARRQEEILNMATAATLTEFRRRQAALDSVVDAARAKWPDDPVILALAGYQKKNGHLLRHWNEIQAGMVVPDDLLHEAALLFSDSLDLQPDDASSLNGLGSVLILSGELTAAEFFVRSAIERMKAENQPYQAAEDDLKMIARLRSKRERPWRP